MLALKNVLAEGDEIGSLVFDEVDTGVSGRAAQKVAEKMAQVAQHKQVLCVTHLPQIAAMADTHFAVSKGERGGRTYTALERLDRTRRREELARLCWRVRRSCWLRRNRSGNTWSERRSRHERNRHLRFCGCLLFFLDGLGTVGFRQKRMEFFL